MEHDSALAVIAELAGSLVSTLDVLTDFEAKFASGKVGDIDAHAGVPLKTSCQDLVDVHSRLRVTWIRSSLNGLSDILHTVEQRLDEFKEGIRNVEIRSRLLSRRNPKGRDVEAIVSSIILAKNMICMIKTLQGRGQGEEVFVNGAR